jgi:inosine-uridine nucleoside N-ribohydrolase
MTLDAPVPVLFDTDIGSDIDDAVALAYLLKQPRCELLGITTVTGNTQERAALAEIVCRAENRTDIPIYAGLSKPLLHGPGQPEVPQYEAVKHLPHQLTDGKPYSNEAVLFLRDMIRSRPGEITLLAVGPMTNIAALFALDPEIPSLLKSLVLMCGVYTGNAGHGPGSREWNALVDPVATGIVYKHGAGKLVGVGLDVTEKCRMPAAQCRERFTRAGGALAVVGQMAEVWFKRVSHITFHDPLAATVVFDPSLCTWATGNVTVHVQPGPLEGMTQWKVGGDEPRPHSVASVVNSERFFEHYFGVTGG